MAADYGQGYTVQMAVAFGAGNISAYRRIWFA